MQITTPKTKFEEHRLKKGDMVFIPSSETIDDLGYSSLIDFDDEDVVYSYHIIRFQNKREIYHYFKKYLINHSLVLSQFSKESKGTTRQIIGRNVFNNINVVLPPINEQEQIVAYLDKKTSIVDTLISSKEQKINLLKEKRTTLINHVITKGLDPNVKLKKSGVEWIGEIPKHWEKLRLKDLVSFDSGYAFNSSNYVENGVNLIRIGSLYENKLDLDRSPIFLPISFLDSHSSFVVSKGDILISLTGTLGKRDYGYSIVYNLDYSSILNQRVGRIKLSSDKIQFQLLTYILHSEYFLNQLFAKPTGTKQGNFSEDNITSNYIILPTKEEQQKIVEYLDTHIQEIDELISLEYKKIETLKEYRQALISEVVTGKIKVVKD
jgi:type I restriction enzyme S subunit